MHRRLRLVQPSVLEDHDRGRGRVAPHERRAPGSPGPLAHRLRAPEGRRREGVHVRRQLPPRRAPRGAPAASRWSASPRSRRNAPSSGRTVRGAGRAGPGRPRDAGTIRGSRAGASTGTSSRSTPNAFAGRTNQVVCDALEAEGVGRVDRVRADVQLRPVPAVALATAGRRGPRRPPGSVPDVVPGRRGRRARANPSTSMRTSSAPIARASSKPSRRSRRSSATRPSCPGRLSPEKNRGRCARLASSRASSIGAARSSLRRAGSSAAP